MTTADLMMHGIKPLDYNYFYFIFRNKKYSKIDHDNLTKVTFINYLVALLRFFLQADVISLWNDGKDEVFVITPQIFKGVLFRQAFFFLWILYKYLFLTTPVTFGWRFDWFAFCYHGLPLFGCFGHNTQSVHRIVHIWFQNGIDYSMTLQ